VTTSSDYVVWLYGSHARGDDDWLSDIDIFVAVDGNSAFKHPTIPADARTSVSRYTWTEVEAMAAYGSLFLHHLCSEGRSLAGTARGTARLEALFRNLPPYQLYHRDIRAFRAALADASEAGVRGSSPTFELSVLGTVVRHSSVLACYLLGTPSYGRREAIGVASRGLGVGELAAVFEELYSFRLHADGRCPPPERGGWPRVREAVVHVGLFLQRMAEVAHAYEARVLDSD
jgi:hypothetical protein